MLYLNAIYKQAASKFNKPKIMPFGIFCSAFWSTRFQILFLIQPVGTDDM
jgi:hypothetical protein